MKILKYYIVIVFIVSIKCQADNTLGDPGIMDLDQENTFYLNKENKLANLRLIQQDLASLENQLNSYQFISSNRLDNMRTLVDSTAFNHDKFRISVESLELDKKLIQVIQIYFIIMVVKNINMRLFYCCCSLKKKSFFYLFSLHDLIFNCALIAAGGYSFKFKFNFLVLVGVIATLIYVLLILASIYNYCQGNTMNTNFHVLFSILRLSLCLFSLFGILSLVDAFVLLQNYKGEDQIKLWLIFSGMCFGLFIYFLLNFFWSITFYELTRLKDGTFIEEEIKSEDFDDQLIQQQMSDRDSQIFVFSEGKCQNLFSHQEIQDVDLTNQFKVEDQINLLFSMISNIGKTINNNALFMSNLQETSNKRFNIIAQNNKKLYEKLLQKSNTVKSIDIDQNLMYAQEAQNEFIKSVDYRLQQSKKQYQIFKEDMDISLQQKLELSQFNNYKKNIDVNFTSVKDQAKGLATISQMENEFQRIEKRRVQNEEQITQLETKFIELQFENKRLSSQNLDQKTNKNKLETVQKSVDAFEEDYIDFKEEFEQKLIKIEQEFKNFEINFSANQKLVSKSNKKIELIQQQLQINNNNIKQNDFAIEKSGSQSMQSVTNNQNSNNMTSPNLNNLQFTVQEIEEKLIEIERTFSKKLLTLDNNIKEFDDIKKINKIVQRLQLEMNSKVNQDTFEQEINNRIQRNEFFDFVNQNLVYKDKIRQINYNIDQITEKLEQKLNDANQDYQKFSKIFQDEWKKIAKNINFLFEQLKNQKNNQEKKDNAINDIKQKIKSFKNLFKQFQNECDEKFNVRLNSLTTTHGIRCLSCGEKDINYPPLNKYTYGDDQRIYLFENNDVKILQTNQNQNTVQNIHNQKDKNFRILSGKTTASNNTRFNSSKNTSYYEKGENVFNKKHLVREHQLKSHQNRSAYGNLFKKNQNQKVRPMTSIPKQHII